jgi:hypothetical protein
VEESAEGGSAFGPVDAAPPLQVAGAGVASRECVRGLSGLRGYFFSASYGHPGPDLVLPRHAESLGDGFPLRELLL